MDTQRLAIRRRLFALVALVSLVVAARAQFLGPGPGPYDYNNPSNWTGGVINGVFTQNTSFASQKITFGTNTTLTTGLTLAPTAETPVQLNFTSTGSGPVTITLGGDILANAGVTTTSSFGSLTPSSALLVDLGGNRTFNINTGSTVVFTNTLSGLGSTLTKAGTGILNIAGDATYTGGTIVTGGLLVVGDNSTHGSIAGDINVQSGAVVFNRNDSTSYSGVITGGGYLQFFGGGTTFTPSGSLTLNAQNDYSGGTYIGYGTLVIGTANALPTYGDLSLNYATLSVANNQVVGSLSGYDNFSAVTIAPGKIFTISPSESQMSSGNFAGSITNAGTLRISGETPAPFTFTGTYSSTLGGSVLIDPGAKLQIGFGGTSGDVSGNVTNNGLLLVYRTDTTAYGGVISGAGNLALGVPDSGKGGLTPAGTLLLTNQNTYTGETSINSGTLAVGVTNALPVATRVITTDSGTLYVGANQTIAGLNGDSGGVFIDTGINLTINTASPSYYGGVIDGAGSLTKSGSDTLVLVNSNAYTGGTTINAGRLKLGDGDFSGSILGDVVNNGVLEFNSPNYGDTIGNVVSGTGSVVYAGSGGYTVTAANTYSGGTTVSSSLFAQNTSGSATGTGKVTVDPDAYLVTGYGTTGAISGDISNEGQVYFSRDDNTTYAGAIAGSGYVFKHGEGTLTFTGQSTYTGSTGILSGTLADGAANAFSAGSAFVVESSATLQVNFNESIGGISDGEGGGTVVIGTGAALTLTASAPTVGYFSGDITGAGALVVGGQLQQILLGNITHTGGTTIRTGGLLAIGDGESRGSFDSNVTVDAGGIFQIYPSGSSTYSSVVSGGGDFEVRGFGTLNLLNQNTYTGSTFIHEATLNIGVANALPTTGTVSIFSGGTLNVLNSQRVGVLQNFNSESTINIAAGQTLTQGGLASGGGAGAFRDIITGSGSLALDGNSSLYLTGDNTYSGGTVVANGTLIAANESGSATGTGAVSISPSGTLQLGDLSGATGSVSGSIVDNGAVRINQLDTYTLSTAISGSGSLVQAGPGSTVLTGNNTFTGNTFIAQGQLVVGNGSTSGSLLGNVIFQSSFFNGSNLAFNRADPISFAGFITGTGSVTLSGSSTVTLSGANSYLGDTLITGGTLADGAPNSFSPYSVLRIAPGAAVNVNFSELTALNDYATGTSGNVVLQNGAHLSLSNSYLQTFSGVISGAGDLSYNNQSTGFYLTNANTFTGGTTISAGTVVALNATGSALGTGAVKINGTSAFLVLGNGGTIGSVSGDLINNGTVTFNRSDNITYSGAISGAGVLVQSGPGVLALNNSGSTFTGSTFVSGGTLQLAATNAISTLSATTVYSGGTLDVAANQTLANLNSYTGSSVLLEAGKQLTLSSSNVLDLAGNVQGAGSLAFTGTGAVLLEGNNTYTGGTIIQSGTVQVGTGGTTGSLVGPVSLAAGSGLTFFRADDLTFSGSITGTGAVNQVGGGTLYLTNTNSFVGSLFIASGLVSAGIDNALSPFASVDFGSNTAFLLVNGNETVAGLGGNGTAAIAVGKTLTVATTNAFSSFGGSIAGAGSLVKTGSNILSLGGSSTFSGSTTILDGKIIANNTTGSALGSGPISISSGATLQLGSANTQGAVGGSIVDNGTVIVNRTDSVSTPFLFTNTISGTGAFVKTGSGYLLVASGNSFSGGTTVNDGRLILTNTTGSALGSGIVAVNGPGVLQIGTGTTSGSLTGNIVDNGSVVVSRSDAFLMSNFITGTGSLVQTGSGTLVLSANNTYTGGTTIGQGYLILGTNSTSGSILGNVLFTGTTSIGGGELQFNRADTITFAGNIAGDGRVSNIGSGTAVLTGTNSYTGNTFITSGTLADGAAFAFSPNSVLRINTGASTIVNFNEVVAGLNDYNVGLAGSLVLASGGSLTINGLGQMTYSGVISGGGSLIKNSTSSLLLFGANTYTGGTTVLGGTLRLEVDNALSALTNVTLSGSPGFTAFLGVDGNQSIASLTGNGSSTLNIANGKTLTVGGNNASTTYGGAIGGAGNFTKTGTGTLVLTGSNSNSLTGSTLVALGTLRLGADNAWSPLSTLTVANGATLDIAGNQTIRDLNSTGSVTIATGKTLTVSTDTISRISGVISGGGGLVKDGALNLVLFGDNTYTGGTTVAGGQLQIGSSLTSSGSILGNVALTSLTSSITFARDDNLTFSGAISGVGGFLKAGVGTLTLTGNSTYTGGTTLSTGTLVLGADNALSSGTVVTITSGTLQVNGNQTLAQVGGGGGGAINIAAGKALTIAGTPGTLFTGAVTVGSGSTLQIGTGGPAGSIASNIANSGSVIFNRSDSLASPYIYSNVISGSGNVTKSGSGVVSLTGNNTYTGVTFVAGGGLLEIGNGGTTGFIAGNITLSNSPVEFFRSDTITYGGLISGTGNLFQFGTGTTYLTGASTYSGSTTINNGALVVATPNALPAATSVTVQAGATLSIAANQSIQNLNATGTTSAIALGTGTTLSVSTNTQSFVSGNITGGGAITKTGNNTLVLAGNNTFTGGLSVIGGSVQIGNVGGSGNLASNVTLAASTSLLFPGTTTYSGVISGAGAVQKGTTGLLTLLNNNTYTGGTNVLGGFLSIGVTNALSALGNLNVGSSTSGSGVVLIDNDQTVSGLTGNSLGLVTIASGKNFTVSTSGTTTYGGSIDGAGTFVKNGSGTLVVLGDADYTGGTVINGGMLQFGNGTSGGGPGTGSIVNNGVLMVTGDGGMGSINPSQVISGTGSLVLSGSFTFNLSNANTYAGGTTINSGKLLINNTTGSALGTGAVVLNGGATLGGNGSVSGAVTVGNGATLSPGNSPGAITLGPTTLAAGSVFNFEINDAKGTAGTNWDVVNVNGQLVLTSTSGSPFNISLVSLTSTNSNGLLANFNDTQSYSWQFATASGGITGLTSNNVAFQFYNFQNPFTGNFNVAQQGNSLLLNFTPVPEPSTWISLIAGTAMLAFWWRRRR